MSCNKSQWTNFTWRWQQTTTECNYKCVWLGLPSHPSICTGQGSPHSPSLPWLAFSCSGAMKGDVTYMVFIKELAEQHP